MDLIERITGGGECKQVIVARSDLKLTKGKLAAQVAHAAVAAADKSRFKGEWVKGGQKKSVLEVKSERELLGILQAAKDFNLPCALIEDAGRTEIAAGTKTCVGIGPAPEKQVDKVTGHLKLI